MFSLIVDKPKFILRWYLNFILCGIHFPDKSTMYTGRADVLKKKRFLSQSSLRERKKRKEKKRKEERGKKRKRSASPNRGSQRPMTGDMAAGEDGGKEKRRPKVCLWNRRSVVVNESLKVGREDAFLGDRRGSHGEGAAHSLSFGKGASA